MDEIEKLKEKIQNLEERNQKVESDKAWETSRFRVVLITVVTYIVASLVLRVIGVGNPFLNSLIPTIGYFLSTLSLPFIKKWWTKNKNK